MERSLLNVQQQLHVFMASLPTQVRDSLNDDPEMQELFRTDQEEPSLGRGSITEEQEEMDSGLLKEQKEEI
ncbi:unnamed protein product [Sphagnum troendelagicum]|uniref:Uncharacterized protein n=1 Tax=Sphagnum troendelagicum TaxID=128251 RepID=A0ABP0TNR7_9BRYO